MTPLDPALVARAAEAVAAADALLITAGAGMGVDSGLPDFRGPEGFWRAYPAYRHLGLAFEDLADPRWFREDPGLAWGFYGHRRNLYRATRPHAGFGLLREWAGRAPAGGFVFTSNVDGQFQRAGFDPARVVECHGAIDWSQCLASCGVGVFEAEPTEVPVDPTTFRAAPPHPTCPGCGGPSRPSILMFGDWGWDDRREREQSARLQAWLRELAGRRLTVIELGAGTHIPTVRRTSERLAARPGGVLVRVNPREPELPGELAGGPHVGLAAGGRAALEAIAAALLV